jgi:heat shock protein HtpX
MPTLWNRSASNKTKSIMLFGFMIAIVMVLGYFFGLFFGGDINTGMIGLGFAFVISIIWALISYYASDKIALTIARAKPADEKQFLKLHNIVEGLAIAAGIPKPKVYVMEDKAINAFATGRNPQNASVCVTTGALEKLDKWELEGVIAHELSHVKNRDILLMTLTAVMIGVIALISDIMIRMTFFSGSDNREGGKAGLIFLAIGLLFAILSPIIAMLIQLAISRKREFLADSDGALLTRYPDGLANALLKIEKENRPVDAATSNTAHMYFSNPLRKGFLSGLFATHPPIAERVAALKNLKIKAVERQLESS